MKRLTRRAEADGIKAVYCGKLDVFLEGEPGYVEADKLARYEDLEESGKLLVLPEAFKKDKLFTILGNSGFCPNYQGLKKVANCSSTKCWDCWEAALKGGGQDE